MPVLHKIITGCNSWPAHLTHYTDFLFLFKHMLRAEGHNKLLLAFASSSHWLQTCWIVTNRNTLDKWEVETLWLKNQPYAYLCVPIRQITNLITICVGFPSYMQIRVCSISVYRMVVPLLTVKNTSETNVYSSLLSHLYRSLNGCADQGSDICYHSALCLLYELKCQSCWSRFLILKVAFSTDDLLT